MHPTRKLLLDTAAQLLETHNPDAVTGQMVLRASEVSHGSLYHHFDDASEVVETVLTERFFARAIKDAETLEAILADAPDRESWFSRITSLTLALHVPANRIFRMRRVQLLAYAASRPRMLERLERQQGELTSRFAAIISDAQQRGWLSADVDPQAAGVLIQAVILGRVIDDVSITQADPEQWDSLLAKTIRKVFGE